jgi:hypothetical protein
MSDSQALPPTSTLRIGMAADHGGFELKEHLAATLREAHYEVFDFGDGQPSHWSLSVDTSLETPAAASEESFLEEPQTYRLSPLSCAILLARSPEAK